MDELDTYARAAARLGRLEIDDAWWPGVLRHLGVLCDNAALVEAVPIALTDAAAPPTVAARPTAADPPAEGSS
ncbi:MAG TPA: AtzG-like protein [Solirubrobacteraceae bacterium]|nr:AtzG-like protein [Solirubrobacteraceae bacterium]